MNGHLDIVDVTDESGGFYQMALGQHMMHYPEPRWLKLDWWKCGGTIAIIRKLKSIYPQSLQIGNSILTLYGPNCAEQRGPYRVVIKEQ